MSDEQNKMQALFAPVEPDWSPGRRASVSSRIERRLNRSLSRRFIAVSFGLAAVGVLAFGFVAGSLRGPADSVLRFDDGSVVTPLSVDARLERFAVADPRVGVRIHGGAVHFAVTPNPARIFYVDAGPVLIEVLGTAFSVSPVAAGTRVLVEHGRVRVRWSTGNAILVNGESGTFPPPDALAVQPTIVPTTDPIVTAESISEQPAKAVRSRPVANRIAWKSLAQSGRYEEAFVELDRSVRNFGGASTVDGAEALLLAADTARLSGHPSQAVPHLRELVRRYPRDPRASLGAFTLGVVLLDELGRPRDAGPAFALSRKLAPRGDLVEDAWAREVESLFRSGDSVNARRMAEQYLKLYPSGRRAPFVRRYGGM
jgi:transmembrane sensor